jgi:hypothetical protein
VGTIFGQDHAQIEKFLQAGKKMNFQRITIGLIVLLIAGLAGSFYMNWNTLRLLQTTKAFVEGAVFAEAVAACEKAQSTTPFKWNGGKQTAVIGLNSVKLNKDTIIASYTLFADGVYCDYDPVKKKANVGSNFLERD